MLYQVLVRMINRGQLDGLQEKLDVFYAVGRISETQYTELCELASHG